METPLQLQKKAVRIAIRDYERELIKAEESGRTEWVEDTKSQIKHLSDLLVEVAPPTAEATAPPPKENYDTISISGMQTAK